ncbi:MAG: bifunctional hydroxymethylpyrimidine kinase/phosphomethylpyrimidine kinase, partial [Solobacterium sp.]|nr:bifunctional hydroxymethylpyrimidine kinase/phosphomethylpyrimidine kinase [Solobacterium sp.]
MGITVIGAVFIDIKGFPLAQYIPGGRNVGNVVQVHGGVSRNIAEDIGNVNLKPNFLSVVDDSGTSADVLERLQEHGVCTDYIVKEKDGLGIWLAIFDNQGDVTASISKRPDLMPLRKLLLEKGEEIFQNSDSIALEIDLEEEVLEVVFDLAEQYQKPVFAAVSNMSIAMERRNYLSRVACLVCNQQEAGILFTEEYEGKTPEEMQEILVHKIAQAKINSMVVTMGGQGSVYASLSGESGFCPAQKVDVVDTTGAGDTFFSGVAIGLTYHKSLAEACEIGTRLASSVIATKENVCPRYQPEEFG